MSVQNYKNHIRFYPLHHFVFYPIMLLLIVGAIYFGFQGKENVLIWIFIVIILIVTVFLSTMMRQHYALTLQDRIVRLEMRYRYFSLTHERLELIEHQLRDSQLFALRFAPDEELPNLVKKAIEENLSGNRIKKNIVNWFPDNNRV